MDNTSTKKTIVNYSSSSHDLPALLSVVKSCVRRHTRRHRCTPEELADLFQDGCIAALAASSSYQQGRNASYRTWLTRRVQGEIIDSARKLRSHGITHLPAAIHSPTVASISHSTGDGSNSGIEETVPEYLTPGPDVDTEHGDILDILNAKLPAEQRKLLKMHYGFDGEPPMSTREIGEVLGISHTAVEGRLDRALRMARGALN